VPKVTIYLPDDLHAAAKGAGLNISGLTQEAIRNALVEENGYDLEQLLTGAGKMLDDALRLVIEQT
jgi:hypothetical protein